MNEPTDYDGAWKQTLERFFPDFLSLALPDVAATVALSAPVRFLDTELQEIVRDAEVGRLRVDKLVEVKRLDGAEAWILIHVEIQSQRDDTLALRMFRYCYRLLDRFNRPLISLAVLADPQPDWKPAVHAWEHHGCELRFQYRVCKLAELDLAPWLARGNPVARIIQAHRCAQATGRDPAKRRLGKLAVVRQLFADGRPMEEVREVLHLINWLLALPAPEELRFRQGLFALKHSQTPSMPYITTYDRLVREEGLLQGIQQGLEQGLEQGLQQGLQQGSALGRQQSIRDLIREQLLERFGSLPDGLVERLAQIHDEAELRRLVRAAFTVPSLNAFPELPPSPR